MTEMNGNVYFAINLLYQITQLLIHEMNFKND